MKKSIWILAALPILMAGCSSNKTPETSSGTDGFRAAVVTDEGGLNDQSFNASAWRGAQKAEKEMGIKVQAAESREPTDYTRNLRSFAKQKFDVVFAVGYSMQDAMNQVAPEYPDVKLVIIDGDAPQLQNSQAIRFKEQEGSFLAGALAAAMSKTGKIGFIGGMHGPVISRFECGYKAGAKTVNPNIQILSQYTESWVDSLKGKEFARQQFSQGADIIFHASGKCGIGVIDAAKDQPEGRYAIGVDSDQDHLAPGKVLTSMVKNIDVAVFDTIQNVKDGKFTPGDHVYGLKEGGVGLSEMKHTKDKVPAEAMKRVDDLKAKVIAGTIVPPEDDKQLADFYTKNNLKP